MIKINLLPEDLKQTKEEPGAIPQAVWYIVPAVFALLVIIHLYLGAALLAKNIQYKSVNKKWAQLSPERKKVQDWRKQHKIISEQTEQMHKLITQRVTLSDKMQILAQALPNSIWFNRLTLKQGKFNLDGSVVALDDNQMRSLNIFLKRLKDNAAFFKDFLRLELGRMNMRTLGGRAIMDFALEGDLK